MYGDITRRSFDPKKRYSAVRQQQGRVQTDADWNEDRDIALWQQRQARMDLIGPHGGPAGNAGLEVTTRTQGGTVTLQVGKGRYYVDGILIDNDAPVDIEKTPTDAGTYVIYLDVWERTVTAVEDPTIREVALGGPDTATRTQVVWKVRALPVAGAMPACDAALPEWNALTERDAAGSDTRGRLQVTTDGFRPRDNRTYRVQIQQGNIDPATGKPNGNDATFVWSRDNGAVLAAWTAAPRGVDVQVDRPGPGGADGFAPGALVELSTDGSDGRLQPGLLANVATISGRTLRLDKDSLPADANALANAFTGDHPKVRRWDSPRPVPVAGGGPRPLENGLSVTFTGTRWRTGDHWIVAARAAILPGTVDRQVDWPVDPEGKPQSLPPHGPDHHYVRLAAATLSATRAWTINNCRRTFGPLTAPRPVVPPVGPVERADGGAAAADTGGSAPVPLTPDTVLPLADWPRRLRLHLPFPVPADPSERALRAAVDVTAEIPAGRGRRAGSMQTYRLPGTLSVQERDAGTTALQWVGQDDVLTPEDVADGEVLVRVTVYPGALTGDPQAAVWRTTFFVGA
ncbi:DUF6519 domain-containing protein [Pseudonocardia sp.]|uniref:DUF6519 domain-containing protein n=1 Tax=Pseudonocardia sp. TaxID=60912 RepID=UPI003D0A2198